MIPEESGIIPTAVPIAPFTRPIDVHTLVRTITGMSNEYMICPICCPVISSSLNMGVVPSIRDDLLRGGNALERSGRGQPSHGAKVIEDIQKPRQDLLSLAV
jgi:hypothetical protein